MAEPVEEYLAVLKAAYDYLPQSEDEITIKEDQIVFLLERTDDDWWKVKPKTDFQEEETRSGLVPAAYVEPAPYTSVVKALYDYNAAAPGELTITEDELLLVYDREDEWILVQSQKEGGKAGFVPGNYVEEVLSTLVHIASHSSISKHSSEEEEVTPSTSVQNVTPPVLSGRPASVYVDPADLVAQTSTKAQADDIQTWAVSEVDKKGKKKKGNLGIGNGAIFFASESDKTPVQKWKTVDVQDVVVEKQKHLHIDIGGSSPTKLHFAVGSKDVSDAIVNKLESSKGIHSSTVTRQDADSRSSALTPPPGNVEVPSPSKKNAASVRFTDESPEIIPPREPSEDGEEEFAIALYAFESTGPDELPVQEGEQLWIVEKEGEDWWKCRNKDGREGVVPASYLELTGASTNREAMSNVTAAEEEARLEAEMQERERERLEQAAKMRAEAERMERDLKKAEEEQRAKAAEMAAEAEKKRRQNEETAAAAESERRKRQEAAKRAQQKAQREQSNSPRPVSSQNKPSRDSTSSTRKSSDATKTPPPPGSTRTWHDRSGQFKVEAAFVGYTNGKLRLHKVNGVTIEVPSEKMSLEDMRFVERLMAKRSGNASQPTARKNMTDDDDQPLALKRQSEATKRAVIQSKRVPQTDWFEFFLSAGCDVDDCTRYALSFEKDKIDESILPDITESTMRSLGLREGDIIRVNKAIQQKYAKSKSLIQDQISRDEELARKLQEEESGKKSSTPSPAPNLFAGPGGVLKNNTQRRGRPQPSKSLPPPAVDMDTIGSASEHIKRTGSPLVATNSPTPAVPGRPSSAATAVKSGFDDDAWTNRPGQRSSSPASAPPATAPRASSVPPATQTTMTTVSAVPSTPQTTTTTPPALPATVNENQHQENKSGLEKSDAAIFDQLARLSQLRTNRVIPSSTPVSAPATTTPPVAPPPGYNNGLGMGPSPVPLMQHVVNQQTGTLSPQQNAPRGPFAPVPANQGLLQPLVPTTTGFNSFVPTRSPSAPSSQFLQPQPTGFVGTPQPLLSQPTGFPVSGPLLSQPLPGSLGNFALSPSLPNTATPPMSTGLSSFGQPSFSNMLSAPSPTPPQSYPSPPNNSNTTTSPANVFAQMKSGTFATDNDNATPQQAEKYDALRVNSQPTGFVPQITGWGFQPVNGYPNGYTRY
ncbi:hypothetical protein ID866_6146 [Astraeus odoratus]|nr:hypothetical protein ID866_6146 [Astraeus odoratus]